MPGTVLLIDTADFGGLPGDARLMKPSELAGGGVSTHAGSPRMLARYLEARTGARVALLAIQPGDVAAGEGLSAVVQKTAEGLVERLKKLTTL